MRLERFDLSRAVAVALFLAAVLLAWLLGTAGGNVDPLILPAPGDVFERLGQMVGESTLWSSLWVTLQRILAAFALAAAAALLIGVPVGRIRRAYLGYTPLLGNLAAIPLFALYPLMLLVFGIGGTSKVVFGLLSGFFPMVLAVTAGTSTVEANLLAAARSMGAGPWGRLVNVILPAALPDILAGMRMGLALCTLGVLGGEILGSSSGLGYQLAMASESYMTLDLYAYVLVALLLTAALSIVLSTLIRLVTWR